MQNATDATNNIGAKPLEVVPDEFIKLALRVADCLHTAMLVGKGFGSGFRAEAKSAESELREFANLM